MCIIFLAYRQNPKYPLILLANRDEFYERPSRAAHFWEDAPEILAGRDLLHGGTWLGVTGKGRFAAVTNYRDPLAPAGRFSRGNLVGDFLRGEESAEEYLKKLQPAAADYSGFNLLVGEIRSQPGEIAYFSNRENKIRFLTPGIYGLSNHLLDTPWPKVKRGKAAFEEILREEDVDPEFFFKLLDDRTLAEDQDLPDTGIGFEREKLLSPIFIETPVYGTRCSTVVLIDKSREVVLDERNFR